MKREINCFPEYKTIVLKLIKTKFQLPLVYIVTCKIHAIQKMYYVTLLKWFVKLVLSLNITEISFTFMRKRKP